MSTTHIPAELRRTVHERAGHRCEYCHIPAQISFQPLQVDHIIAEKHGGTTTHENLAASCIACNLFKGSDIASLDPLTGKLIALFHPRIDRWDEHFGRRGPFVIPKTPEARATVRLLQFNSPERITEREWIPFAE